MRRILVANPSHKGLVFAHVMDDNRTVDIVRGNNKITITGKDFTVIGTDPFPSPGRTAVEVREGQLVEEDIKFKEDKPDDKPETVGGQDPDGQAPATPAETGGGETAGGTDGHSAGVGEGDPEPVVEQPNGEEDEESRKFTRKVAR